MTIGDADLDFESHIGIHRDLGQLTGDTAQDQHWHHNAQRIHTLCVIDGILDTHFALIALSESVSDADAKHQLRYGASRRTKYIWHALRSLLTTISPDRHDPLPLDDVSSAGRDLNDIYIHMRGTLDNFAWALLHLFAKAQIKALRPSQVDLFGQQFGGIQSLGGFIEAIETFRSWSRDDLGARRNPGAHRIPLAVPPAVLGPDDQVRYEEISTRRNRVRAELLNSPRGKADDQSIDDALLHVDALDAELTKVGRFVPIFYHDPGGPFMPIYPTVPQDVGMLTRIFRRLRSAIADRSLRC
jgi:hypothetical protein